MNYDEILKSNGWVFWKECLCGGSKKHKYNNPDKLRYIAVIAVQRNTFQIQDGQRVIKAGPITNLEKALSEI